MLYMTITLEQNICSVLTWNSNFSTVSARIWNAVTVKFNVNTSLSKFKESLKQYLLNNILIISYPK